MQRYATAGLVSLLAAAGSYLTCAESECTMEARPSVKVRVVQEIDGRYVPLKAEAVQYRVAESPVDGGETRDGWRRAECADPSCTEWYAGWEEAGEFTVNASVCGTTVEDVALVELTDDECHVDTETLTLVAQCPVAIRDLPIANAPQDECTRESRPSVVVSVVEQASDMFIPVVAEKVEFTARATGESGEGECINDHCSKFTAGREQSGAFVLDATVCGNTFRTTADVPMTEDGCHVETQHVALLVDRTGCLGAEPWDAGEKPGFEPGLKDAEPGAVKPTTPGTIAGGNPNVDATNQPCPEAAVKAPPFVANLVHQVQDMILPIPAESVTYTVDGVDTRVFEAECLNDTCSRWQGDGPKSAGRFAVTAKVCGETFTHVVPVEMDARGCGFITQTFALNVDRRGCLGTDTRHDGEGPRPGVPTSDKG